MDNPFCVLPHSHNLLPLSPHLMTPAKQRLNPNRKTPHHCQVETLKIALFLGILHGFLGELETSTKRFGNAWPSHSLTDP